MISRILYNEEEKKYDSLVTHPLQTWAWGEFKKQEGHQVVRLGVFEKEKMISAYQVFFHPLPHTPHTIGYLPRGPQIDQEMLSALYSTARDQKCIFIKIEPDLVHQTHDPIEKVLKPKPSFPNLFPSPKSNFWPFTYLMDLQKSEEELFSSFHKKTRYNIKIAQKHAVQIVEDNSPEGFNQYLDLLFKTAKRQGVFFHTRDYHQKMYAVLKPTGMVHILLAKYQDQPLSAFMLFKLKDRFFYPYGASSSQNRQVMASTLLMWESILLGKRLGCKTFDTWGSLGPDAKESDFAYGVHRFKQGFGGILTEFVGSYDYVLNHPFYKLYTLADSARWKLLRLKAKLPF
jgi:lipid II:glycine glycyltransferase (peptidoglycan interpeptide bridge formation enzyme)